jgi:hypothetical protein
MIMCVQLGRPAKSEAKDEDGEEEFDQSQEGAPVTEAE